MRTNPQFLMNSLISQKPRSVSPIGMVKPITQKETMDTIFDCMEKHVSESRLPKKSSIQRFYFSKLSDNTRSHDTSLSTMKSDSSILTPERNFSSDIDKINDSMIKLQQNSTTVSIIPPTIGLLDLPRQFNISFIDNSTFCQSPSFADGSFQKNHITFGSKNDENNDENAFIHTFNKNNNSSVKDLALKIQELENENKKLKDTISQKNEIIIKLQQQIQSRRGGDEFQKVPQESEKLNSILKKQIQDKEFEMLKLLDQVKDHQNSFQIELRQLEEQYQRDMKQKQKDIEDKQLEFQVILAQKQKEIETLQLNKSNELQDIHTFDEIQQYLCEAEQEKEKLNTQLRQISQQNKNLSEIQQLLEIELDKQREIIQLQYHQINALKEQNDTIKKEVKAFEFQAQNSHFELIQSKVSQELSDSTRGKSSIVKSDQNDSLAQIKRLINQKLLNYNK